MKVIKFAPGLIPVIKHEEHDQKTHGSWAGVSGLATLGKELLTSEQMKDFDNEIKKVPESHIEALRASGTKVRIMDSPKVMSPDEAPHFNRGGNEIRLDKNSGASALLHEIGHALDFNAKFGNGFLSDDPNFRKIIKDSKFPDFSTQRNTFARNEEFAVAYENYYTDGGKFIGASPTKEFKQVMEGIGEYILLERVSKHQEHDQKTHGNWATFTSDELIAEWEKTQGRVPASPPNPEGTNTQALRSWVDGPFRNFSGNYPINDVIRHIQHGILGLPLTPYYEVYSDRQRYIDERTLNSQTRNLIESLDNAPQSQPTLWRGQAEGMQREGILAHGGMGYDSLLNMKEGDEFVATMFSTSRDKDIASMYAQMGIGKNTQAPAVIFRIEAGAKGLRTSTVPMDKEVLTGGKFKVTGTAETTMKATIDWDGRTPIMKDHPVHIISLTQLDTFGKEDYVKENFQPDSQFRVGRNR